MRALFAYVIVATVSVASLPGCGVVRYREITFTVRDEVTNAPLPQTQVSADMLGVMFKLNAGKVDSHQAGTTNEEGVWKVTLPTKRVGGLIVSHAGYEHKVISIQEDTLRDGSLEIKLKPLPKPTPDERQGPAAPDQRG
jgi:hypothetical protein